MSDIEKWLGKLSLQKYVSVFVEAEVDFSTLPHLTDDDLKELGLPLGPRRKVSEAIKQLQDEKDFSLVDSPASPSEDATHPTPVTPQPSPSSAAERRQLTVMFCDLVGSTELSQRLDPEDMREINRAYQDAVKFAIERFEGYVARYMGDGVLAYFGYPQAHEDDAERAIRAGLGVVDAIITLNADAKELQNVELAVRVGIATGSVVVGDLIGEGASQESAVVGETPNLAARLQGLAQQNEIVIGANTRNLVGETFELANCVISSVKGYSEPVHSWRVIRERQAESRFEASHAMQLASLVGRDEELDILCKRWDKVLQGEGQIVLISGEAGMGKSRLMQAFRQQLSEQSHTILRYQGSPYHTHSPWFPVIDQLERAARFVSEDDATARIAKLRTLLAPSCNDIESALPLIASLLSIPIELPETILALGAQRQKDQSLDLLSRQPGQLSLQQPVLMLFEDAHWVDPTTLDLLNLLVSQIVGERVLVLLTHRPEFHAPWTGEAHVTSLVMTKLAKNQCLALMDNVAGEQTLPDNVRKQIVERTDGSPLFVEELTKDYLDKTLRTQVDGIATATESTISTTIPATLKDSLMARLDHLGSSKELAQIGSVVGREFGHELLVSMTDLDDDHLETNLQNLLQAGLIYRRGTPPHATYIFKHALIQDSAYESLLKKRRQQLHQQIALSIEQTQPTLAKSQPEIVARHYTEAGQNAPAVELWLAAARLAINRLASLECIEHSNQGLALLSDVNNVDDRNHEHELALTLVLGAAYRQSQGYAGKDTERVFKRAVMLTDKQDNDDLYMEAVRGLSGVYWVDARFDQAETLLEKVLHRVDDPQHRHVALYLRASIEMWQGQFSVAARSFEEALRLFEPTQLGPEPIQQNNTGAQCEGQLGITLACLGFPEQALLAQNRSFEIIAEHNQPWALGQANIFATNVSLQLRLDPSQYGKAVRQIGAIHEIAYLSVWGIIFEGIETIHRGDVDRGIQLAIHGCEQHLAMPAKVGIPFAKALIAEACQGANQLDKGFEFLEQAKAQILETGEQFALAELHRLKGQLVLAKYPHKVDAAEGYFRQAIDVARQQSAKLFELRATTNLAELMHKQGRSADAHEALSSVYNWFTEGFEIEDLKQARNLLKQLS